MNKNKLIFIIIWILFLVWLAITFTVLNKSIDDKNKNAKWDFTIWTYGLDKENMTKLIQEFKDANSAYKSKNIVAENFSSYSDYKQTLISAFISWKAPDVFLLSNFEKWYLENHALWINPETLKTNDFRKNYKGFISDDLIREAKGSDWKTVEFVAWIPVWYETLGVYYNKRFNIKSWDLNSWSSVRTLIEDLNRRNSDLKAIWVSDFKSSRVYSDVISQFFLLWDTSNSFKDISDTSIKEAFENYYSYFWSKTTNSNSWNYYANQNPSKTNLEMFSEWDLAMIVAYPSMTKELAELWFDKNLLWVEAFPHYYAWKWGILTKYSYFVVNKDTREENLAFDFLTFLSTENWARQFLDKFTFLLPALDNLEKERLDKLVNSEFNTTLWDFFKWENWTLLSSFDKVIDDIYDLKMDFILTQEENYINQAQSLQKSLVCKYTKISNFTDLSSDCDNY